jgi:hypothetical protein
MATPRFACHSDADIEAILNHYIIMSFDFPFVRLFGVVITLICYFSVKSVKLFIKYVEELISSLKQSYIWG